MANEFSQPVIDKALRERPWLRKVGPNRHRVTPRTAEHGKYELTYHFDADGAPVVESCIEVRTKEPCLGFSYKGYCYHSASLVIHLLQRSEKKAAWPNVPNLQARHPRSRQVQVLQLRGIGHCSRRNAANYASGVWST